MNPVNAALRSMAVAALAVAALTTHAAHAQDAYPNRPIRFVVPFTPGAGTDRTARVLAPKLSAILGQPIVVENRGGASGAIGTEIVARAEPDGYTWVLGHDPAFTINQHLRKMPYDPLKDFAPVSLIATVPLVLVASPASGLDSVQALVDKARQSPDKLTMASSGNGTSGHLAAEVFMATTGTKLYHVPYKGQAEAVTDVLAGRADLNFSAIANVLSLAQAGRLKVLGIGAPKRFADLPGVPTIAELGYPGFDVSAWHGLLMPAGTPPTIVRRVSDAVSEVLKMPDVAAAFASQGVDPVGGPPERLGQLLQSDSQRWAEVIREAGIKTE